MMITTPERHHCPFSSRAFYPVELKPNNEEYKLLNQKLICCVVNPTSPHRSQQVSP